MADSLVIERTSAGVVRCIIDRPPLNLLEPDLIRALRDANIYEKQSYRHILGLPSILKNGGGEAECETPFLVIRIMHDGQSDVFATGVYLDTLRAAGNDLKFARRLVICDSSRIDTLMALPL